MHTTSDRPWTTHSITHTLVDALRTTENPQILMIGGSPAETIYVAANNIKVTAQAGDRQVLARILRDAHIASVAKNIVAHVQDVRDGIPQWPFDGVHCANLQLCTDIRSVMRIITELQNVTNHWGVHTLSYYSRFPGFLWEISPENITSLYQKWSHFALKDLGVRKPSAHDDYFPLYEVFARK